MNKHRINIFIALVLVLIIIAAVSMWLTSRDIKNTVTVSVGLDDAEEFDVFADASAQSLIVMLYRVERDLCPCSAESGSHAVTFIPEC